MKKMFKGILAAGIVAFAAVVHGATTNYVFTADGVNAATAPRQLPQIGKDFTTGAVVSNLSSLAEADLAKCGWYRVVMPPVELGPLQYMEITGYTFFPTGTAAASVVIKDGAPLKKYTQYKIIGLLMKMGKWQQVKQYLVDNDLFDLFMGAQYLTNADENFLRAKKMMGQLLGVEEAVIDELLETCVDDE